LVTTADQLSIRLWFATHGSWVAAAAPRLVTARSQAGP